MCNKIFKKKIPSLGKDTGINVSKGKGYFITGK